MEWTYTKDNKPQTNDICLCKFSDKHDGQYAVLQFRDLDPLVNPCWFGGDETYQVRYMLNDVACWMVITDDTVDDNKKCWMVRQTNGIYTVERGISGSMRNCYTKTEADKLACELNKKQKEKVQKELERMQDCVFNMQKSINTLVSWKDALK